MCATTACDARARAAAARSSRSAWRSRRPPTVGPRNAAEGSGCPFRAIQASRERGEGFAGVSAALRVERSCCTPALLLPLALAERGGILLGPLDRLACSLFASTTRACRRGRVTPGFLLPGPESSGRSHPSRGSRPRRASRSSGSTSPGGCTRALPPHSPERSAEKCSAGGGLRTHQQSLQPAQVGASAAGSARPSRG